MSRDTTARRILVTGGAGFIGSHLVEGLLAEGCEVTVIDDLSTGRRENLPVGHEGLRLIEQTVSSALPGLEGERFEAIYHLAAVVGVELILRKPVETIDTNIIETSAILAWARRDSTPILLASSSEVYGKAVRIPLREDDDILLGPSSLARWAYAATKLVDEYLGLAAHSEFGLPVVVARFFNTVGPRQTGRYGMVLPRFVASALRNEPLRVYGDGRQSRAFCDVRDVVSALPPLLQSASSRGRVFNIGSERRLAIADLARLVIEVLVSRSVIELIPYEQAYGPGFEDIRDRQPDIGRIRAAIGWEPTIPLEQTIRDIASAQRASGGDVGG